MTIARLCRRVWAARHGYCEMPRMTADQAALVVGCLIQWLLFRTLHERPPARGSPSGRAGLGATRERSERGGRPDRNAGGRDDQARGRLNSKRRSPGTPVWPTVSCSELRNAQEALVRAYHGLPKAYVGIPPLPDDPGVLAGPRA